MPPDDAIDDRTLLCEDCGYVVEGLPEPGVCPECGTPLAESLPERRVGSPYQQDPSPRNRLRTAVRTLRSPIALYRLVRVDARRCRQLLYRNLLIAALLAWLPSAIMWITFAAVPSARGHPWSPLGSSAGEQAEADWDLASLVIGVAVIGVMLTVAVLRLLVLIEELGLRFFGDRRRWRITRDVALTVCSHASIGWVVGSGLSAAFIALGAGGSILGRRVPGTMAMLGVMAGSAFLGLLVFETLAYIGMRCCRFANRPRER